MNKVADLKNRLGYYPGGVVENTVYLTPKAIIDLLGPFDMDVAAAAVVRPFDIGKINLVGEHEGGQCGLKTPWKGFVWCNPPYGKLNGENKFLAKLAAHNNGIALLNVKPATELWRNIILPNCSGIILISRRVKFTNTAGVEFGGSFGSQCLIAFGQKARKRLEKARVLGHLLEVCHGN